MTVTLYKMTDDSKVVSKTLNTQTQITLSDVKLKDGCSVLNPTLLLAQGNLSEYNYMYIADFGRYYYLKPGNYRNGLWEVTGEVDVLMTYDVGIRALECTVLRNENEKNGYMYDSFYQSLAYKKFIIKGFTGAIDNDTMYFQTVG